MLEVCELKKSFARKPVLKGVSFQVKAGETVVLMGPSGCGKSTTIRCINLLLNPDGGRIIFKGQDLSQVPQREVFLIRQEMGFVFQRFNLVSRLTARENVMLALLYRGVEREKALEMAEGALEEMGLHTGYELRPAQLSGGEQQRVALARALVMEPELILLDEPTASLDPILVKEVLEAIEKLSQEKRRGVLLVTHEVALARRIADRIILMDCGRIVEEGPPARVFESPRSWVGQRYQEISQYH